MKVKRLTMRSFRGIDNLTLDFDPNITVLIGNNGVGKSSTLDCLAILLSKFVAGLQLPPITTDNYYDGIHEDFYENYTEKQHFSHSDIAHKAKQISVEVTVSINSKDLSWGVGIEDPRPEDPRRIEPPDEDFYDTVSEMRAALKVDTQFNLPLALYYPINRSVANALLEINSQSPSEQLNAYKEALKKKQVTFEGFFMWFRALEDLENEERRDDFSHEDIKLKAVRDAVVSFLPGFLNLRVRRSPLRMTVQKQGQELIINQLSDGEKCLLAMVGDLARRLAIANPGLPDPLQGDGVVLIDEIELHLHPKWQRNIVPALTRTFPNCQFIVTTHSPQVLGEVKGKVYRLKSTSDGIIAESLQTYGRDSAEILEDEMEADSRSVEIKEQLRKLFRLIEDGDLEAARALKKEMAEKIGNDESEFVKAEILIRRHEVIGR